MQASEVEEAVASFAEELKRRLGDRLRCVALYGSLVKGGYDPERSDHNVALVLDDDDATALRTIAEVMRNRRPSRRTGLLILTKDDLENGRDVFALKFRDLSRHHRVVLGEDLFGGLGFEREALRLDCEHQLRAVVIRLRRLFVQGERDPARQRANVTESFRAFLPPMAGLIELESGKEPASKEALIEEAARLLDASRELLDTLWRWTTEGRSEPSSEEVDRLVDGYARALKAAARRADELGRAR